MGLMDRLEAARGARAEGDANVIDLREAAAARAAQAWGRPGPCPDCGGVGYLDSIDMVNRVMHQHCTGCGLKWQVAESELVGPG